jgi:hypothetical protein
MVGAASTPATRWPSDRRYRLEHPGDGLGDEVLGLVAAEGQAEERRDLDGQHLRRGGRRDDDVDDRDAPVAARRPPLDIEESSLTIHGGQGARFARFK